MPRPPKCRRVCSRPATEEFAPAGRCGRNVPCVVLGMDEYEAIRLIDLLRMTQAQCAEQMGISRTTGGRAFRVARVSRALAFNSMEIITEMNSNVKNP